MTIKRGERVTIRLIGDDRAHGLLVKPLGVDLDASPNDPDEITIAPAQPGTYPAICDHYCGMGHGGMKMTFVVAAIVLTMLLRRRIETANVSAATRTAAAISLVCWIGAIAAGRFLAYFQ